jgi:hypothetical protein
MSPWRAVCLGSLAILAAAPAVAQTKLYRAAVSSADPRDFSGVWNLRLRDRRIRTTTREMPPLTPLGQKEWKTRSQAELDGNPVADASAYCWPHGVPRVMNSPYPIQFIASPGEMTIVHEVAHNTRHIYLDEPMPAQVKTTFMGTSVGRWEGDTLVVQTKGVDDRTWIDEEGIIHSKELSVVERFRKIENGMALEDEITITDPVFFTKSWVTRLTYGWRPDMRITEYICEENNRNAPQDGHTVARIATQ